MNNLNNIVFYIKDEPMLQEAREILERYGEKIGSKFELSKQGEEYNYAFKNNLDQKWYTAYKNSHEKEITLPELEQLLKQKRDDQSK